MTKRFFEFPLKGKGAARKSEKLGNSDLGKIGKLKRSSY